MDASSAYQERVGLQGRAYRAFFSTYPWPNLVPPHFHDQWELVVFHDTRGSIKVEAEEEPIREGRSYCVSPGTVHSYRILPGEDSWAAIVQIDMEACSLALSPLDPVACAGLASGLFGRDLSVSDGEELAEALRGLARDRGDALRGAELLLRVLRLAPRFPEGSGASSSRPRASGSSELARRVIAAVQEDFRRPLDLDGLADRCAVSKYHLCRAFKSAAGCTIGEFLTGTRMVEARRLLADGSTVEEAARNSGFADTSYFVQRFKRETGSTPKRWAREYRRERTETISDREIF